MKIPDLFRKNMKDYFIHHPEVSQEEFWKSFDETPFRGVRLFERACKGNRKERLLSRLNIGGEIPWCPAGYYTSRQDLGKSPYYLGGAFYIQEPSAMLPAELLKPVPGDKVLDLCAAPGGKATRLGEMLKGNGLLVANEVSADRAKALLRNVELFGIENVVVVNESPQKLVENFPGYFDKILVDAPCSGEGMFRRDPQAVNSWEIYGPENCAPIQKDILEKAHIMLRPGGQMVYSTCTFNRRENEEQIDAFLYKYPGYRVISHEPEEGVTVTSGAEFSGALRIWPQNQKGDGHFCVHMEKGKEDETQRPFRFPIKRKKSNNDRTYSARKAKEAMTAFCDALMSEESARRHRELILNSLYLFSDKIHLLPVSPDLFNGIKIVKMGAFPGTVRAKGESSIFTPSHSFAMSLDPDDMKEENCLTLCDDDERVMRYLKGETIFLKEDEQPRLVSRGRMLISVEGYSLGWGQRNGIAIKNEYPAAWRIR